MLWVFSALGGPLSRGNELRSLLLSFPELLYNISSMNIKDIPPCKPP